MSKREVKYQRNGLPKDLPCPRPEDLVPTVCVTANGRGCGVGWARFAFSGDPWVWPDGKAEAPYMAFLNNVWRRTGMYPSTTFGESSYMLSFDGYADTHADKLKFCHAWRAEAEALGFDTSGLTPLEPLPEGVHLEAL